MRSSRAGGLGLVGALVAADQHVLFEGVLEVGERGGAHGVKGGDHTHPLGRHLQRLLGGRALPDPEHPGRLAADGGGKGHGRVDQQLTGLEHLLEVGEGLGLAAEGHAEDDDLGGACGAGVVVAGEAALGNQLAGALGGFQGAALFARADLDRHAGAGQTDRQTEAQGARGADHRDRI